MNSLFKYLLEPLEWLKNHKGGSRPEPVPEMIPNSSETPWRDELISLEKNIHQAASQGLSITQYRDFVISSLDSLLLNNGALPIDEIGVPYDAIKHRPSVAVEVPDEAIVSNILQAGVMFNGRVLKRATVEFTTEK